MAAVCLRRLERRGGDIGAWRQGCRELSAERLLGNAQGIGWDERLRHPALGQSPLSRLAVNHLAPFERRGHYDNAPELAEALTCRRLRRSSHRRRQPGARERANCERDCAGAAS